MTDTELLDAADRFIRRGDSLYIDSAFNGSRNNADWPVLIEVSPNLQGARGGSDREYTAPTLREVLAKMLDAANANAQTPPT